MLDLAVGELITEFFAPIPVGKYEPYLWRTMHFWSAVYEEMGQRASEADWKALVATMTRVQKLVHLASRWTGDDRGELERRIFDEGRITYRDTMQQQLNKWGCAGQRAVVPSTGAELTALKDRAKFAAESVTNTYNLNLARAIIQIGEVTPTANRNTYGFRLFYQPGGWDAKYWEDKSDEVAKTESMTMVNAAIADFYDRNGDLLVPTANILPIAAVCPICQNFVKGNPYRSVQDIYRRFVIPPHPNCPHRAVVHAKRLRPQECRLLWAGS